jgi:hypothetical protein
MCLRKHCRTDDRSRSTSPSQRVARAQGDMDIPVGQTLP